jgi:predicted TIM-barrel fold metal-dependent hydrolase
MLITDSQVHLWGPNTAARPWPAGRDHEAQKPYPVTKDMLLFEMELAKVDRIVLVPPSWEGDRNDLALEAARLHPDRFAVMGRLDLRNPGSRALVADWKKAPGMLGMRFTFHNQHNRHFLTDGTADWLWPAAEAAGIPLMVLVPGSLDVLDGIAARHPGLRLVIDHVGLDIRQRAPAAFVDLPAVCALAKHPNVAVKASGLPSFSTEPYPFRDVHDAIRRLVDAFGPRRTFWGTDLTRMPCSYRECIDLFTREQRWLTGEDLEWVMGRGVSEWLGWPPPAAPARLTGSRGSPNLWPQ